MASGVIITTILASSSGVLALQPPRQHHYPRLPLPSQHRCLSHCFDDPNRTLRRPLILNQPGSPRQRFRRPRRHYRDWLERHRRSRRDLRLGGRLRVLLRTV
jgi:hypothetical protein